MIWAEQALTADGLAARGGGRGRPGRAHRRVTPGRATAGPAGGGAAAGAGQCAQPRLPARHGRPDRAPRPGSARQLLDLAAADVPLPRPARPRSGVEAIAAFVQMEMLEAGYGASVEFHYLHHQPGGAPYDRLGEMSERIAAAAADQRHRPDAAAGALPVRRLRPPAAGTGADPLRQRHRPLRPAGRSRPAPRWRRCRPTPPWASRRIRCARWAATLWRRSPPCARRGRSTCIWPNRSPRSTRSQAAWGRRPVEWLLDHLPPDRALVPDPLHPDAAARDRWRSPPPAPWPGSARSPRHPWATASSTACAGWRRRARIAHRIGFATSASRWPKNCARSNIRSACATIPARRWRRPRNRPAGGYSTPSARAARRRRGATAGAIAPGRWADLLALDGGHPDLDGRQGDAVLDSWIFAGDDRMVTEVWSAGRHLVQDGRHRDRDAITLGYRQALRRLGDLL